MPAATSSARNWGSIRPNVEIAHLSSAFAFLDPERRDQLAAPVGSLPVVYAVHRTNVISGQVFPLLRLPLRHVDNQDVAVRRTRAALEDLVGMMKAALCHNVIVYRRAENPQQQEPDWAIFERTSRRRKTWKWRLLPADQETWRTREKLLDQMVPGRRTSGLTSLQVLTVFDYGHLGTKWWMYTRACCVVILRS